MLIRRPTVLAGVLLVAATLTAPVDAAPEGAAATDQAPAGHAPADTGLAGATPARAVPAVLPLGPRDLPETRTTETLQPGVTLTTIVRGAEDPAQAWTVEVAVPGGSGSPDPDAPPTAVAGRARADRLAAALRTGGFTPRVEEVTTPPAADHPGGPLGFRVRVGRHDDRSAAEAERARVRAAGHTASTVFTGWDGAATDRGPWVVRVLTVDPRTFRGELAGDFGPDLERRERTGALAAARGATAAVNGGFFVLDPAAGAPGDPAGLGVYDGRVLSESVGGRPSLLFSADARRAAVARPTWSGSVAGGGTVLPLDGVNRVPGLIRNCGGTGDAPTDLPRHDTTCTDQGELVAFTPEFGAATPSGEGAEVVLDARDRVVEVRSPRGGTLPPGGRSVQGTGARAAELAELAEESQKLTIRSRVRGPRADFVVNGGPELVRDGRRHATPAADGMIRPGDPSFTYGWVTRRNPRTLAGVDARGRILLATADGRATASLGLSIAEAAAVAQALGMRDAVNLDGGGSTTMVAGDRVINAPSDAAGERPVGDAILVLPER
ncbi:phosphodiester glycosidase family protein [Streptomyces sp. NPDC047130]|uniref:phosphodiester glycosidase family protein n=1 Tax=Streptomyces sp. NPDC047130 TaxID=3155261 RepID=UPI0034042A32